MATHQQVLDVPPEPSAGAGGGAAPPAEPEKGWSSGVFACASDADACCLAFWCPCIQFGQNQERAFRSQHRACCKWTWAWCAPFLACYIFLTFAKVLVSHQVCGVLECPEAVERALVHERHHRALLDAAADAEAEAGAASPLRALLRGAGDEGGAWGVRVPEPPWGPRALKELPEGSSTTATNSSSGATDPPPPEPAAGPYASLSTQQLLDLCKEECELRAPGWYGLFALVGWCASLTAVASLAGRRRSMLRQQYRIKGSLDTDMMCHCCCGCCALAQEARQIADEELTAGAGAGGAHAAAPLHAAVLAQGSAPYAGGGYAGGYAAEGMAPSCAGGATASANGLAQPLAQPVYGGRVE